MEELIYDTLIDGLKLFPFLFLTFLLIEVIEHKINKKNKKIISNSGKYGPFIGGILGVFPQCGFGVSATNLYATRIISVGTLISIYLSTSDEMLPIMLSDGVDISFIAKIIGLKIIIGIFFGFLIDLVLRKKNKFKKEIISDFCDETHCDCDHGIVRSSLKHTVNIFIFIIVISFVLNLALYYLGEKFLANIFMKNNIFGSFIASFVGLIPNCAASVVITELYLNSAISFGSMIAGLLTGSGVSLIVLFKTNKNIKDNIKILLTVYLIGAFSGLVINILSELL